jgi:hypothetical protein
MMAARSVSADRMNRPAVLHVRVEVKTSAKPR